jgi:MbtH protein
MPEDRTYQVVRNHEEQYSLWPAGRPLPLGWSSEGTTGTREECLARVTEVWTDMRPLSVRRTGQ